MWKILFVDLVVHFMKWIISRPTTLPQKTRQSEAPNGSQSTVCAITHRSKGWNSVNLMGFWCGSCGYSVAFLCLRLGSRNPVLVMGSCFHGDANPIRWRNCLVHEPFLILPGWNGHLAMNETFVRLIILRGTGRIDVYFFLWDENLRQSWGIFHGQLSFVTRICDGLNIGWVGPVEWSYRLWMNG